MDLLRVIKSIIGPGELEAIIYNPIGLILTAVLLSLCVLYLQKYLQEADIESNSVFLISITPFILTSAALEPIFSIYHAILFVICSIGITIAIKTAEIVNQKLPEHLIPIIGSLIFLSVLSLYSWQNLEVLRLAGLVTTIWILPLALIALNSEISLLPLIAVGAHYLDASSTYAVLKTGGFEQHFFARLFTEAMGPSGIFIFKTLLVVPIAFYIDQNFEKDQRLYYLYFIAILGVSLGVRNILGAI